MSQYRLRDGQFLVDPTTNRIVGIKNPDGTDYFFATANTPAGASPYNPASVAVTGGTINGTSVGVSTPAVVKASDFQGNRTDISGTPGNGTVNNPRGRAAFAAAGTTVVVTNSLVNANSTVLVQLGGSDATLTTARATAGAGSFTVTGNAAATGTTPFDFFVIN